MSFQPEARKLGVHPSHQTVPIHNPGMKERLGNQVPGCCWLFALGARWSLWKKGCWYWFLKAPKTGAGFPCGSVVKNLPGNAGGTRDKGSVPGLGRSPGVGNGNPLHYFSLKNPMDRVAWWATVHSIAESDMTEATEHACRRRGQLTGKNSRGSGWNTNTLLQGTLSDSLKSSPCMQV